MDNFLNQLIARCRTKASELHTLPSSHANSLMLRAEARGLDDLAGLLTRLVGVEDAPSISELPSGAPILPFRIVHPDGTPTVESLQAEVKALNEIADHRLGAITELEAVKGGQWVPLKDRVDELAASVSTLEAETEHVRPKLVVADVQAGNPPQTAA